MLQILTRREKGRGVVAPFRVLLPASLLRKFDAAPHRPRIGLFRLSFLFCVVAPALLAAFYLSLFASDQYVSEAHFTIRKAGENRSAISDALSNVTASMGMASLALGTSSSNQDIFIVADYIRSRTIIDDVGGEQFLKDIYARDDVDWLSRLSRSAPFLPFLISASHIIGGFSKISCTKSKLVARQCMSTSSSTNPPSQFGLAISKWKFKRHLTAQKAT